MFVQHPVVVHIAIQIDPINGLPFEIEGAVLELGASLSGGLDFFLQWGGEIGDIGG